METFRDDNTEGFTAEQLDWANAQWLERHGDVDPDSDEGKVFQARILDEAALVEGGPSAACLGMIEAVCAEGVARSDVYPSSPAAAAAAEYGVSRGWLVRAMSGYAVTAAGLDAIETRRDGRTTR